MADETPKPKRGRGGLTRGSWKPGQSGNPKGRPRTGLAFAERVRERVDPDTVIDLALEVAADTSLPATQRLAALLPLIDRGFIKPATVLDASVTTSPERQALVEAMVLTPHQRQERIAELTASDEPEPDADN